VKRVPSFAALRFFTTSDAQDCGEFIAEVSATFDRIGAAPESYPAWPGTRAAGRLIRKAAIQRFPHLIAFEQHEQHLLILAVAHAKRRPLYWLTRVNP